MGIRSRVNRKREEKLTKKVRRTESLVSLRYAWAGIKFLFEFFGW